ncbi:MAG: ergothioneine biosynthesis protein EgtB [Cyclobacteriaceae bacterium]|nr:ergothioneine biosynthesis protein EgtB [Cyclobacteriaceae bacterium]
MHETSTISAEEVPNNISQRLLDKYNEVRNHTLTICAPLRTEDFVVQPIVDVSPPKWHMAHTTWFFEEFFLSPHYKNYKRFHPRYAFLFNSYYETVGERVLRPNRGNMSRPTVDEIVEYRKYVDAHMREIIPTLSNELLKLLELGLNHEQQHQELLLTDIKYILGHNPLFPPYDESFSEVLDSERSSDFVAINVGIYEVGHEGDDFNFDNERNRHKVYLQAFEIQKRLVTNEEFMRFIDAGAYQASKYWHSDGWAWVKENDIYAPLYWHKIEGKWYRYAMAGLEVIDPNAPVTHVSMYEAFAYAEWAGMRLPTEFEWEVASEHFQWGERWEHTNSAYLPYPGFQKADGAIGEYNGKFMVNQMVLRGASVATPVGHSRPTYRNFFQPNLRWQFTGIRLCKR